MVFSCVPANCTNKASLKDGISMHTIPYFNDDRPEAKKRRKISIDFVKAKRVFTIDSFQTGGFRKTLSLACCPVKQDQIFKN